LLEFIRVVLKIVIETARRTEGAFKLKPSSCQVENAAYDKYNDDVKDNARGLRPSDHKPVSAIFEY
jgi:hypothetical protein